MLFYRESTQHVKRHVLQHRSVGGLQHHRRRHPGAERLDPPAHAQAPTVAGFEAGKVHLWSGEVVAPAPRKVEKLFGDNRAHNVSAGIGVVIATKPVASPTGVARARSEGVIEHISAIHIFVLLQKNKKIWGQAHRNLCGSKDF